MDAHSKPTRNRREFLTDAFCGFGSLAFAAMLQEEQARADTPAKRIYLAVQLMYTSRDPRIHHEVYFALIRDIVQAAPSTWPQIESINNHILRGELYKALKQSRKLIAYEEDLFCNATRRASLQKRSK